jgi:4-amino-4-deoxy-L-arabinose transferase-like glycosyltransferase
LPLGIFVLALVVRVLALRLLPFDGLYGQDAYAYYDYAVALRTALLQGQGAPPFFWPIGFPLHAAGSMLLLGVQPLAAQSVSVIAGALLAPVTFFLAREAARSLDDSYARRAGIIAGLLVALAGQLMISSLSIMSDATAALWTTISAWLTLRYARTLKWPWFVLAVLTLSLAVITRWIMALLAVPWTVGVLWCWRKNWSAIGWRRSAALIGVAALIGFAIVGGQFLSGSHTGDLRVVGWNPLNAVRREVHNTDGTFQYALPMAAFYAQPLLHPAYVFPLFLPLLLIGLWSLGKTKGATRAVLIGWPLMGYLFLAGIAWQNPRFALAYFPPLAVWVGLGFAMLWGRVNRSGWRWALSAYVAIALIGTLLWSYRVTSDFITRIKDADLQRVAYVTAHVPREATVLSLGLTSTLSHYTDLDVRELYNENAASLTQLLNTHTPFYLMIDLAVIEQQWQGHSPHINLTWLLQWTALSPIGSAPPYTLFKVEVAP